MEIIFSTQSFVLLILGFNRIDMTIRQLPLLAAVLLASCSNNQKSASAKPDVVAANVDTTVNPSDDFFQYANGGWIKSNPIPEEQSSWGIGNLVIEENLKRLRSISEQAAEKKSANGSADQLIGDFWHTGMDSVQIEKEGLKTLQPYLEKIKQVKDLHSLLAIAAEMKTIGSSTLFGDYVGQDAKNSEVMAYQFYQGGIGLPEREYYFKSDSATTAIRNAYVAYIEKVLTMSGKAWTRASSC